VLTTWYMPLQVFLAGKAFAAVGTVNHIGGFLPYNPGPDAVDRRRERQSNLLKAVPCERLLTKE
jgi:hypothetical protein